ncbi:MAG TPA: DUF2127 domain-containing protein [Steroidobacteraceae bacterium]|nr:DUF2127 domain-containing protein [Steroidobacteraceae bacterium]
MKGSGPASPRFDGLRLIGLLKICKALLLLATSYGLYRLLNPNLVEHLQDWLSTLTDTFERRLLQRALEWLSSLGQARIGGILVVTGLYTGVLLTEGIGLWLRKTWAEWLTVIATASLIPFELWQLVFGHRHNPLAVLGATTLNIAIVWYLVWRLRQARRRRRAQRMER